MLRYKKNVTLKTKKTINPHNLTHQTQYHMYFSNFFYYTAFSLLFFMLSCANSSETTPSTQIIQKLNATDFYQKLQTLPNVQLIDLRLEAEIISDMGYIEGAKFFNYYDTGFQDSLKTLKNNKPVMLYCTGGKRSDETQVILEEMGFKEVYDLVDGIQVWRHTHNYPVKKLDRSYFDERRNL